MPFKSKAQRRFMYAAESRGEIPKGTAARWEKHTKNKSLPEHVKTAFIKSLWVRRGIEKTAQNPIQFNQASVDSAFAGSRAISDSLRQHKKIWAIGTRAVGDTTLTPMLQVAGAQQHFLGNVAKSVPPQDTAKVNAGIRTLNRGRSDLSYIAQNPFKGAFTATGMALRAKKDATVVDSALAAGRRAQPQLFGQYQQAVQAKTGKGFTPPKNFTPPSK